MVQEASAIDLLGGARVFNQIPTSQIDTHAMLQRGLPANALKHLVDHLDVLKPAETLEKAVGISLRTYQRHKDEPDHPLSVEQSGRIWRFAEVFALAIKVFGTQREAELWLQSPAMALNRDRPIDLLTTPAGIAMVEELLGRIYYNVYT